MNPTPNYDSEAHLTKMITLFENSDKRTKSFMINAYYDETSKPNYRPMFHTWITSQKHLTDNQ